MRASDVTQRLPLPVRVIIASILMAVGAYFAAAFSFVAALNYGGGPISYHPWKLWFTLFCAGVVACIAVPSIAWWLLLPRARWFGPAALLALQTIWIAVFVYYRVTPSS
ncbi:hypothetical protein AB0M36_07045 [Actinoplanes sp. NPDC051346]|uniref:hypothetical protein n=1 Tax=Actinoplanes sp. NPDC051346 TaxID=3155048 RepID=UPI00341E1CE1